MANDDSDDDSLFHKAAKGARKLKQDRIAPHKPRRKPIPQQHRLDEQDVLRSLLSDEYEPAEVETGEELLYTRPGIQQRVLRKFRRGQYAIEAELDLHGRVVSEAREMVSAFLREAQAGGKRVVRIIHGKGLSSEGNIPVLKGKVNSWLRQKDAVLAFCSARKNDGGTGAVYVLLKRL